MLHLQNPDTMPSNMELNKFMCEHLDRESLLKCALINKQWYETVILLLFKNIPKLKTLWQKESFYQLLLKDYNWKVECQLEKQHLKQQEKCQKQSQKKRTKWQKQQPQPRESTNINPTQEANSLVEDVGCAQIQIQVQPVLKLLVGMKQ